MQSIKGTTLYSVCRRIYAKDRAEIYRLGGRMQLFLRLFFFYTKDTFIHNSFIHKHSLRLISISSQLWAQWAEPPEFYRWYNGS